MKKQLMIAGCCLMILGICINLCLTASAEEQKDKNIKERIATLKHDLMKQSLNLDDATIQKIIEINEVYYAKRKTIRKMRFECVRDLKTLTTSENPKNSEIKALIKKLSESEDDLYTLRRQEIDDLSKILTTEQLGRYLVFTEEFNHELKKKIREARKSSKKDSTGKDKPDNK